MWYSGVKLIRDDVAARCLGIDMGPIPFRSENAAAPTLLFKYCVHANRHIRLQYMAAILLEDHDRAWQIFKQ